MMKSHWKPSGIFDYYDYKRRFIIGWLPISCGFGARYVDGYRCVNIGRIMVVW